MSENTNDEKRPFCTLCEGPVYTSPESKVFIHADARAGGQTIFGCPIDGARVLPAERVGWREAPPPPPPDPMKEAIRGRLRALLDAPEIDARVIAKVIRVAKAAREMLHAEGGRPRLRSRGGLYASPAAIGMQDGMDDFEPDEMEEGGVQSPVGMGMYGGAISGAPFSETFGSSMIREGIAALGKMNEKPEPLTELLDALDYARKNGMDDLVPDIQEKIRDRLKKPVVSPPPRGGFATMDPSSAPMAVASPWVPPGVVTGQGMAQSLGGMYPGEELSAEEAAAGLGTSEEPS